MTLRLFFLLLALAVSGLAKNVDLPPEEAVHFGTTASSAGTGATESKVTLGTFDALGNKISHSTRSAVQNERVSMIPKRMNTFPLAFHFDPALGKIERTESDYLPKGKLGITRIYVRFDNVEKIKNVQSVTKEIIVDERVIGLLCVNGELDKQGRLKVEITEKEPFAIEVKNSPESLTLLFHLDN